MSTKVLLFCVIVGIGELIGVMGVATNNEVTSFRLPNDTIPLGYYVSLVTNIHDRGNASFSGKVRITIKVVEETSTITLNNGQHMITRIDLFNFTEALIEPQLLEENIVPFFHDAFELVQIPTSTILTIGQQYIVEISFNNTLRDNETGFYRSSYNNTLNETRWLATTQFEPTGGIKLIN